MDESLQAVGVPEQVAGEPPDAAVQTHPLPPALLPFPVVHAVSFVWAAAVEHALEATVPVHDRAGFTRSAKVGTRIVRMKPVSFEKFMCE